jgi:Fe2+ or Zn2+ uptake regulation protein
MGRPNPEEIKKLLKQYGLRLTQAREQVLAEYLISKKPLSIFDFKKKKVFSNWDESSIYRNITKLEEAGLIQLVPSSRDIKLYELAPKKDHHHHHHIVCTQCEAVECLNDCSIDDRLKKMAQKVGFTMTGHTLELTGLCSQCS